MAVGNVAAVQQDPPKLTLIGMDQLTMQQRYRCTGSDCSPPALGGLVNLG